MVITPSVLTPVGSALEMARPLFAVGDYDEVLALINPIIESDSADLESKCDALRLRSCVESERGQFALALATLEIAGPLIDGVPSVYKAKFFGQRALVKRNVGDVDGALVDYEAARVWARDAGDEKSEASIRNNVAKIYSDTNRVDESLAEIDAAIAIALRIDDDLNLGRYYDSKAQVLTDHNRAAEALRWSERAIRQLAGLSNSHPALVEARTTHGRALIALGIAYLDHEDPIERFRARRKALESVTTSLDKDAVEAALSRSGRHVLEAAKLLDVCHSAMIRAIGKYNLRRHPKRKRTKK